jgi:hypothetical protein
MSTNAVGMVSAFNGCSNLTTALISTNTSGSMYRTFNGCSSLQTVVMYTESITNSTRMLSNAFTVYGGTVYIPYTNGGYTSIYNTIRNTSSLTGVTTAIPTTQFKSYETNKDVLVLNMNTTQYNYYNTSSPLTSLYRTLA